MKKGLGVLTVLGLSILICDVGYSAPSQTPTPTFDEQLALCEKEAHTRLWVDPINEIEITQRFIPQSNPHQDNLSSHLHRLQHPASYLVRNDNLPNARPSS